MNNLQKLIAKVSIATATIAIALSTAPAQANSFSKKCTHDRTNNRVICRTQKTSTTRTVTGKTTTTRKSSVNFNTNISGRDVENLVNDLFTPKNSKPSNFNNHHRRDLIPKIHF